MSKSPLTSPLGHKNGRLRLPMTEEPKLTNKTYDSESMAWANKQLRYGIRLLQGDPRCGGGSYESALALAIGIKQELERQGWTWQAERLDNWINRARARKGFIPGQYSPLVLQPKVDLSSETGRASSKTGIKLRDFLGGSD